MINAGAKRSYQNGTKACWRGWVWTQIERRLRLSGVNIKQATAAYLAGPENNDRLHAISKGFKEQNLIAVDINQENVKRIRREGVLAVQEYIGRLCVVADKPIDAVIVDYCGGVTESARAEMLLLLSSKSIHQNTVIVWNFLRGRDGGVSGVFSAETRQSISEQAKCSEWCWDKRKRRYIDSGVLKTVGKHRGKLLFYLWYIWGAMISIRCKRQCSSDDAFDVMKAYTRSHDTWMMDTIWNACQPSFCSYKSGTLFYDSVAMYAGRMWHLECPPDEMQKEFGDAKRKWTALKAVVTMRTK